MQHYAGKIPKVLLGNADTNPDQWSAVAKKGGGYKHITTVNHLWTMNALFHPLSQRFDVN
jgi:hypothetical protein